MLPYPFVLLPDLPQSIQVKAKSLHILQFALHTNIVLTNLGYLPIQLLNNIVQLSRPLLLLKKLILYDLLVTFYAFKNFQISRLLILHPAFLPLKIILHFSPLSGRRVDDILQVPFVVFFQIPRFIFEVSLGLLLSILKLVQLAL